MHACVLLFVGTAHSASVCCVCHMCEALRRVGINSNLQLSGIRIVREVLWVVTEAGYPCDILKPVLLGEIW